MEMMEHEDISNANLAGHLLVAAPYLEGGGFHHSVIFLSRVEEEFVIGYILNHPANMTIGDVAPSTDIPASLYSVPIFKGGPVERNQLIFAAFSRTEEKLRVQFHLQEEQALEYAKDSGVLFKSGIMEALHQLGLCDAVYGKLYSYLFGWEPRGVVLHQVKYPSVQEVIATAKAAGAVLVFAHPTVYKSMPLVRQLAKEGIIDGIEVEHPRNSPEDRAECAALCEQYGLIHTGGTDFHGANHKVPHPVGTCTTADDQVARILELAHKRRGIDV